MSENAPTPKPIVTAAHYQTVSGLALAAVILIQLQQSVMLPAVTLVVNVLIGFIGALALYFRARFSPLYVLIAIAAPHGIERYYYGNRPFGPESGIRGLDLADVLLCMAALTYFIGHYRLLGLWFGIAPHDARMAADKTVSKHRPPRVRSPESLSISELIALIFVAPSIVLSAEIACMLIAQPWGVLDLDPRLKQVIFAAWTLLLTMFLAAHAFGFWRRSQMDRVGALLLLQDIVWNETRGEQRRINRWLAWRKLRDKK
jgi:hypothetical protein